MPEIERFGFASTGSYLEFIRSHLPAPLRLTANERLIEVVELPNQGGRSDDAERVRDLQDALGDARTLAVIASNGGGYLTRILPHVDFAPLEHRAVPLTVMGFSEITALVNVVAGFPGGRGVYWLCPHFVAFRVQPREAGLRAFGDFWRTLPALLGGDARPAAESLGFTPLHGELVCGRAEGGPIRVIGGCLSVIVTLLGGPLSHRVQPEGAWLAIEDINEAPYRIDRYLASMKLAGWFEQIAGVLVGDFHTKDEPDQQQAVVELLRFHLPPQREVPVVLTRSFGHTWPMTPLPINRTLRLSVRGRQVEIA